MEAVKMIKDRRSVRKFRDEKVSHETMREIVEISRWAPSWANYQIARYTLIDDEQVIAKIAAEGVNNFAYNVKTLENAKGVAVLSFVKGKSGQLYDAGVESPNANLWEMFDAGIACQTFCLAAHAKGVGTCIFGVIDEKSIAQIIDLPQEQTVAAIIVYGYPEGESRPTPRMEADEIVSFISK